MMNEFRKRSTRLASLKAGAEQTALIDVLASLAAMIEDMHHDMGEIKINLGALRNDVTVSIGQEVEARVAPMGLRLDDLEARVAALEGMRVLPPDPRERVDDHHDEMGRP